ncbi:MAG: DNA double-strand break repair nuclease NurA [Candidatus Nitrosocosmicus sp.]
MNNQLNFQELESNIANMKKSLINNFTNSFFCKDYKKLLESKKLVFVNDDDGIPIQNWGMRSEKYDHMKVNDIGTVKIDKFVFGIDSSCIKVAEVEDGGLYAVKGCICISFKGKPLNHLKVGPFLFYLNEETLKNFRIDHNILKLTLFNDDYAKKFLRINLERYIQFWLSKLVTNSIILIDGSLKYSIFENQFYSILRIFENSVINKNSIIGISKNTKIKVLKYFSYPLLKSKNPSFINIDLVIKSLIRKIYGEHILVKFDDDKYASILRADVVAFDNDVTNLLGTLLHNEFITNGYPSTLQLSHHVSTFSNTDLSSIQGFIKSNYFVKEVYHENIRNSILGSI